MAKITSNLLYFKARFKPKPSTKYEEQKDEIGSHLIKKEKPKKIYDYYICDYCKEEIKVEDKWENKKGGILKIAQSLSNLDSVINLVLCNKCVKPVMKEFEEAIKKRKGKQMKEINIEDYLSASRYTTKEEICEKTGLNERTVRNLISKLKTKKVVIYSSQTKGWRLAKEINSMSEIEFEEELKQIEHSLNDCKSRTKQLNKQKRKYIAYLKKAEQIKLEKENYNHIPRID